jgi:glycine oxidase
MHGRRQVVVIGSGIVGAAIAYELGRRGAVVRVLDDRDPGQGATRASAGMLAPFTEARATRTFADLCVEGFDAYDDFVARLRTDSERSFEYARNGTVEVALDAEVAAHLEAHATALAGVAGTGARWVDAGHLAREEPALSRAAVGALVLESQGFVAVSDFVSATVAAARAHGVQFDVGSRVTEVECSPARCRVRTAGAAHDADQGGLVPALDEATWVEVRVGLRPASPDELPIIGRLPGAPGLVYATAHYRNGVLLAPITARIVADLVLEDRRHPALTELSPERFARPAAIPEETHAAPHR